MFVRGWRGAALALAAACLAGTAGCSGAAKPKTLPPISASPSPPPTPTATDLAQVEAVVRHYYALLNAPTSLVNARALAAIMTGDCSCRDVVRATEQAVAKNQHFFGTNSLRAVTPVLDSETAAEALVTYDYTNSGLEDAHGRVVSSGPGRTGTTQNFRLIKSGSTWLIQAIIRVRPGRAR